MCQLMGIDRLRIARAKWPNDEAAGNRRLRFSDFLVVVPGGPCSTFRGFCLSGGSAPEFFLRRCRPAAVVGCGRLLPRESRLPLGRNPLSPYRQEVGCSEPFRGLFRFKPKRSQTG